MPLSSTAAAASADAPSAAAPSTAPPELDGLEARHELRLQRRLARAGHHAIPRARTRRLQPLRLRTCRRQRVVLCLHTCASYGRPPSQGVWCESARGRQRCW